MSKTYFYIEIENNRINRVIMKKFAIALVLMAIVSHVAFGQEKGDMYVGASLKFSAGTTKAVQSVAVGGADVSASVTTPHSTSLAASPEFGWFFLDNWKLAASVGYEHIWTGTSMGFDGETIKGHTNAFNIGVSVSRYFKLADTFYYTPEIGVCAAAAGSQEVYEDSAAGASMLGCAVVLAPLSLEFRPTPRLGFAVHALTLQYTFLGENEVYDFAVQAKVDNKLHDFAFDLGSQLAVRFYF